jgi:hypothetical protein
LDAPLALDALGAAGVEEVLTGLVVDEEGFEFFSPIRILDGGSKTLLFLLFSLGSPDFFSFRNQDEA